MTLNKVVDTRVPRTMRIRPSTLRVIESRSEMFGMTIGEYVEYVVSREPVMSGRADNNILEILEKADTLKDDIMDLFESMERERRSFSERTEEDNKEKIEDWLKNVVDNVKKGRVETYRELYMIVEEGIDLYNLSDYGVSIIENAFNRNIPIRK